MENFTVAAVVFLVVCAVVAYIRYQDRKQKAEAEPTPAPTPAPVVEPAPAVLTGKYFFEIVPPDHAKWGDGIHPEERAGTANTRGDWAPGQQYRLDGQGEFTRSADGHLQGLMHVCGAPCRINVAVPINGGAVGFATDGVHAEFHFDGAKLTGIVFEPHDKENKYGTILGRRI